MQNTDMPLITPARPLPTSAVLAVLAILDQREVLSKSDLGRLQTLARALSAQSHRLGAIQALPLLFGADTARSNAETSLRKLAMRLRDQQAEAIAGGKMTRGEVLELHIERKNQADSHHLWFNGQASTGAVARTNDLEGAGPLYDNPALAPELLGGAAKGGEPILLLTVNDIETAALHAVFASEHTPQHFLRDDHPYQLLGHVDKSPLIAYRCQMGGMRNGAALVRTMTAIHHHRPTLIIAVGIAFGNKNKQQLGDVLIAEQVRNYESARHNRDGSHVSRAESVPASARWLERCMQIPQAFATHKGLLLSGEKLVDNKRFRDTLQKDHPNAIGGDMEAAALATACIGAKVDWIIVKGVSDWGDGSKDEGCEQDKAALQQQAALHAAQVVYSALYLKPWRARAFDAGLKTDNTANTDTERAQGSRPHAARTTDFENTPKLLELHGSSQSMKQTLDRQTSRADTPDSAPPDQPNAHQALLAWLADPQAVPVFALLGEYGMGKTVSCQRLYQALRALRLRGDAPEWAREPLYFDLRQLSLFKNLDRQGVLALPSSTALIEDLITHGWVIPHGQSTPRFADVQNVLAQGGLLILDGLDECLVHLIESQHAHFVNLLVNLVADHANNAQPCRPRLLLSCRTNFFKTVGDQRNMLTGQHRGKVNAAWYQALVLLPLTTAQIASYLAAVLPDIAIEHVQALIAQTHNLSELAQRPMTLKLLGEHIGELEAMRESGMPVNGAALYGLVAKKWLERDEGKHHLAPEYKLRLMPALAAHLWRSGTRHIAYQELHRWFHQWRAGQADLAERYGPAAYNQTKLEEDLRTATFVVRDDGDDKRPEGFRFGHSSLQEYFLADYLAAAVTADRPEDWVMPIPSAETIHFLAEILQITQAQLLRQYPGQPEKAQRLQHTLNQWRKVYRHQASELLLRYALLPSTTPKKAAQAPYPLLAGFNLASADLSDWIFGTATPAPDQPMLALQTCDFSGADLRDACFYHVRLDGADFSGTVLDRVAFQHCSMRKVRLSHASLLGTVFRHCALDGCVLEPPGLAHRVQIVACHGADPLAMQLAENALVDPFSRNADATKHGLSTSQLTLANGHRYEIGDLAFSPDGTRLASISADSLCIWDGNSRECLTAVSHNHTKSKRLCYSPDGNSIAYCAEEDLLRLWDIATQTCVATLKGHSKLVYSVAFSPNGAVIASGSADQTLRLWDAGTGAALCVLLGHTDAIRHLVFSPDGKQIASASNDNTVRLWDLAGGACLAIYHAHGAEMHSIGFAADGTLLGVELAKNSIQIWDLTNAKCLTRLNGHNDRITDVALSPDSTRVASGSRNTVRVWDVFSGECLSILNDNNVRARLAFSLDGNCIARAVANAIDIWDISHGKHLAHLKGRSDAINCVAFAPDGAQVATTGTYGALKWDATSGNGLRTNFAGLDWVMCLAYAPDGKRMACGNDDDLAVYDVQTGERFVHVTGHEGPVFCVAFSPNGALLASGAEDALHLWGAANGECLATLAHQHRVWSIAFSPDGTRIASGSGDKLRIWDVTNGACLATLGKGNDSVISIVFSPDGKSLVCGCGNGTVNLWDITRRKRVAILAGHSDCINSVAVSPDGTRLVSGSGDATLRLWDFAKRQCLTVLRGHTACVNGVAFSPDGMRIASVANDGTMRLWDAVSGACLRIHWLSTRNGVRSHAVWRPACPDDPNDHGELLSAGGDAWRVLAWRVFDHPSAPGAWTRLPVTY